jgi:hypothetical protein
VFTACPFAVALGGATIVTFVMFVTFLTLVTLFVVLLRTTFTLLVTRIPTETTGGAPVTTAGAVPMGAGMMMPGRDPGGGGMKQPFGPIGRGPATTPTAATSTVNRMPDGGGTKATSGGDQ